MSHQSYLSLFHMVVVSSFGCSSSFSLSFRLSTLYPFCESFCSEGRFCLAFLLPSTFHKSHTRVFGGGADSAIGATWRGFPSSITASTSPYSASQGFMKLSQSVSAKNQDDSALKQAYNKSHNSYPSCSPVVQVFPVILDNILFICILRYIISFICNPISVAWH